MSRNVPAIIVAILVVVVIAFMMCAFQVRFTETAVVTRWNRIHRVIAPEEAGLHFKMPWPIDSVHRYDTRLRTFETEFRQLGTQDQRTVVLTAYATWRVADAEKFLQSLDREDAADFKIRDMLESNVSNVLRTYALDQLVNIAPEKMKYEEIEGKFLSSVGEQALGNYGIEVVRVGIKRLNIPESVTKEVFTRMKEDRQKTVKQLTAEGQAEARKIRAEADEVSRKILARAQAYAKTIEGQGDAEAAKYYQVFAQHRELSDFLKKLEAVQKIFEAGQMTLVMDANDFVPFEILKKVGQGAAGAGETAAAGATSQPADAAAEKSPK